MSEYSFRLAKAEDKDRIFSFLHTHWDLENPFIDHPAFFHYYFEADDGMLRFVLAEKEDQMAALAGFIPSSRQEHPDVWVSFWVADPAMRGAGLELMAAIPKLTSCRTLSCNNIRPKTRAFYEFLGYSTGRLGHFYRLANKDHYQLAVVKNKEILPVAGEAKLVLLPTEEALVESRFIPPQANPYKDLWHITRRYYHYPMQKYEVYGIYLPGQPVPQGLLVVRPVAVEGTVVLRVCDLIGMQSLLPEVGNALDQLMRQKEAEYADFYCAGIAAQLMGQAGFSERAEGDDRNILPNYLEPPLQRNIDYYYFTSNHQGFRMCKADGDQDRPRTDG